MTSLCFEKYPAAWTKRFLFLLDPTIFRKGYACVHAERHVDSAPFKTTAQDLWHFSK